ncbi:hypothetical protein PT015_08570 [Candidatus Mycobacterium wuenschmannii]|uniref:Lipoprotein n=1 Tax=Candidatus Mycobacterium wuenschmannii TaxID=3027808 RepID=A0ABY8W1M7_9MYCO|nr:hypothetical protein [Candidatus Mycobacterium wuenschmannii]WIM89476.1 hypothetical protein PT015_08570 [Candidatus Mycobacterium wuenschmannii]
MVGPIRKFTAFYGAHPLHLLGTVAAWAVAGYAVIELGPHALWNSRVWWQSIGVWFVAAIVSHDLILFPLYSLADRSIVKGLAAVRRPPTLAVSPVNYVRIPTLAAGLSLLLFFPGIIRQGRSSYFAATGQTQEPFLARWLLLVAAVYGVSALAYAVRVAVARKALA